MVLRMYKALQSSGKSRCASGNLIDDTLCCSMQSLCTRRIEKSLGCYKQNRGYLICLRWAQDNSPRSYRLDAHSLWVKMSSFDFLLFYKGITPTDDIPSQWAVLTLSAAVIQISGQQSSRTFCIWSLCHKMNGFTQVTSRYIDCVDFRLRTIQSSIQLLRHKKIYIKVCIFCSVTSRSDRNIFHFSFLLRFLIFHFVSFIFRPQITIIVLLSHDRPNQAIRERFW